jgi:NitT/TauT family transport system permease protein
MSAPTTERVRDVAAPALDGDRRGVRYARASLPIVLPAVAVLAIMAFWQLLSTTVVDPLVLPPPSDVAVAFVGLLDENYLWEAVGVTVWEMLAGFVIGTSIGIFMGTLIGLNVYARRALYPLAVAFQATPQVALAPLFIVWFGFGLTPRILFAATTCVFPVLVGVVVGLGSAEPDSRTLLRSFGASRWQTYRKLLVPASLPVVFAGIRIAAPLALIGALVGEFIGGTGGMGVLLTQFNFQLQMDNAFAVVVMLALIGLFNYGVVELVDRRVVYWAHRHER